VIYAELQGYVEHCLRNATLDIYLEVSSNKLINATRSKFDFYASKFSEKYSSSAYEIKLKMYKLYTKLTIENNIKT